MSAAVVTVRNLGKSVGSKAILHDISVDVEPGSVVGIIGRNGAGNPGRTVLFSTHIVSDLERVADRIWIVRDGTVVWAGPLDELGSQPSQRPRGCVESIADGAPASRVDRLE